MRRIAGRAMCLWLLIGALLGGVGYFCYEYVTGAAGWVLHSGNPHVYGGGQILSLGTVVDRDGDYLLSLSGGRVYSAEPLVRKATLHWLGDRSGNIRGSVLQTYADKLVGFSLINGLYGYGGGGASAKLTLSSRVQAAALAALGDYKGTVAVMNYKTGQLICAVTSPTFDPDDVPDLSDGDYEGVYLNRFTQAAYVPGSIFKIVTTAAALEEMPGVEKMTYTCAGSQSLSGGKVTCERAHGTQELKDAMENSCNCYYANLATQLSGEILNRYVQHFGVTRSISFDGVRTAAGNYSIAGAAQAEVAWSAIGQHTDLINPCAFLTFVGAIANGGQGVQPYVVQSVTAGDTRTYAAQTVQLERIMSAETAQLLRQFMRNNVENNYGDRHFPAGMTLCAKSGTGEVDGSRKPYAMFAGFVLEQAYPLAFIAAVEDAGYGKAVCIPILSQVLAVCQEALS